MADPVSKTILLFDIEKFGPRPHLEQAEAHRVLYSILRDILVEASIEQTDSRTEDRGDGVFVLVDASIPKARLIRALLTRLPTALHDYNRLASEPAQLRLRSVVHAGEVELTENGAIGPALVEAFRLLNSAALHDALATTSEPAVLCVSDTIHHDVVRQGHSGIRAEHFHRIVADSKEGRRPAWVHDAFHVAPPVVQPVTAPAGAEPAADDAGRAAPDDWRPSGPIGNFFAGRVQVDGDVVGGDKTSHQHGGR